jgi:signal transduction histidine kinase
MHPSHAVNPTPVSDPSDRGSGPADLVGYRALVVRSIWLAAVFLPLVTLLVAIPARWTELVSEGERLSAGLAQIGVSPGAYAAISIGLDIALVVMLILVAGLLFWRRPGQTMALYVSFMLIGLSVSVMSVPAVAQVDAPIANIWFKLAGSAGWAGLSVMFYLFPDGRFVPRWTRLLTVVWAVLVGSMVLVPGSPFDADSWAPLLTNSVFLGLWGAGLYAQIYRYRHVSTPAQRLQTKWVLFGFTASMLVAVTFYEILPAFANLSSGGVAVTTWITKGAIFLLPVSLAIAVLHHRLWDIDLIINRTLVYGVLTACVVGLYVLVVGYLGSLFRVGNHLVLSLVATGVVAILFQSLREQLQSGVNRLMYGERDEPYAVIARLDQRLEGTLAPDAVLPTIVDTVREALKLPYVAITIKQGDAFRRVAASGESRGATIHLPLVYQGEAIGELLAEPRQPGETFGAADHRLLDDLARHAGVAAHSVRLTADLQRARERLVTAREEERRLLRRELHDGIGPRLAGQPLALDAVSQLLRENPDAAVELLQEIKTHSQTTISEIRRLARELRPPALDDLGLLLALEEQIESYRHLAPRISLHAPSQLPPLPAAVEVAAYRIIQEALTNVARHADASQCDVRLSLDDATLAISVRDDGRGLPTSYRSGVGMQSIRERTEELGGRLSIDSTPGRGTTITVRFPLDAEDG